MKFLLALMMLCMLGACSTATPVVRKFPDAPVSLTVPCTLLKATPKTDRLSQVLISVTDNYALFQECTIKNQQWLKWYQEQKANFDSVE